MDTKQAQHTARTMALCAKAQRTQDDIWFIRDRLHERCPFFRLWPSQLQQLICRHARPMHWVQHEVLASQGGAPCKDLCFILEGQAAVAVRSAPGSSTLTDVALLKNGDTFGELALLGAQHNPAFIIVRSQQLLAVAVSAQQLAQAMLKLPAPGTGGMLSSSVTAQQQHFSQQPGTGEDTISIDALYKLIGATKSECQSTLSSEQQAHVSRVQRQQLQQAAAAEAATIGTWLAPPHQQHCLIAEDGSGTTSSSRRSAAPQQAVAAAERPVAMAGAAAHAFNAMDGQLALQAGCGDQVKAQGRRGKVAEIPSVASKQPGVHMNTQQDAESSAGQRGSRASCSSAASAGGGSISVSIAGTSCADGSAAGGAAAVLGASDARQGQSSSGAMLRARHSAILHVAIMKAAAAADSLAAGCGQHGQQQQTASHN